MREIQKNRLFHPRDFVENNIQFRTISAGVLSRFKLSQSFVLKELQSNPLHNFSKTAKEILLFKFDVWFDFLCEVEQYFVVNKIENPQDSKKYIINLAKERYEYFENILQENINSPFDENFLKIWKEVHFYIYSFIEKEITNNKRKNSGSFFSHLANIISLALHHTLYELYEIDVLLYEKEKTPFLSFDEFVKKYQEYFGDCILMKRLEVYKKYKDFDKIIIKNYLDGQAIFDCPCVKEIKKLIDKVIIF